MFFYMIFAFILIFIHERINRKQWIKMDSLAKELKSLSLISDDFCSPIVIIDSSKKITFTNKGYFFFMIYLFDLF